ncbi:major facilitator transporter [Rufibacter radiotolerans]|uniref:Major facilitator transporter n=1 Tax=Rufibacter radiotolerans TaxID=1379910 RepID=A0A0H4VPT4_9BACT|nr:MFS transporter [Rufibacter radiotolerans]AKQ45734.1 major facilitator transporter [Rufibacter radiotolerans]
MAQTISAQAKPRLSFWQIWNMSFGFLGIQFGFALQNANVSRIFETLGGTEIALYWLAAPVTGLLVQPIIGYLSDRTWSPRFGRRKPFFMIGAILASISLFLMPNSSVLWMAVGMLWILDSSINISMEPFRALVGDLLPSEQRTSGFAAQTFFIGIGAVVASLLPWIFNNWVGLPNTAPAGEIPPSVKWAFYSGGIVFFLAVLWTVLKTKEYPPEDLEEFEREKRETTFWEGVKETFLGIFKMPKTMLQLAFVQFFTWFALFAMWIFTTPALTSHVYGTTDTTSKLYNEGADWVGVCFAVYNGVSAVFALMLPSLAKRTSRRMTHLICLTIGGLGLISIYFISDPKLLLVSMVGVGIAWASILSMPYAILAGSLPAKRMGYYMGVFNFFIVIPQIVAGTMLDFINKNIFDGQSIYVLVLGGCSMILAGFMTLFVKDVDEKVA